MGGMLIVTLLLCRLPLYGVKKPPYEYIYIYIYIYILNMGRRTQVSEGGAAKKKLKGWAQGHTLELVAARWRQGPIGP